jgi:glycerol-3-phosphate dehydrogenase (NAD(P)+)
MRNEDTVSQLASRGHNPHYLSSVHFSPDCIRPTTDLHGLLDACDTVVFAVPSAYAEGVLQAAPRETWRTKNIISAIKGILPESHLLLGDFLVECYDYPLEQYVAITGPCHAEEVAGERLSYLTFSGLDDDLTAEAAALFRNNYIKTTHNHDIWGAQFAAVLKNIYAVGAGIAHGLDYGDNFLSVYITACYREMHRFLKKHFKKIHPSDEKPDFFTSAYLGDLLVTCYSLHSRNRAFGTMIGKGYSVKAATLEMNMVAEGYYASRGMQAITKPLGLKTAIADSIYACLWEGIPARTAFKTLEGTLS